MPSLPPVSARNCASWPLRERIPRSFHVQYRSFLRTRLCQWLSLRMMVPINCLAHRMWAFEEPDRGKWMQTKILAPCCDFLNRPFCRTRAQYGRDFKDIFRTVPQVQIPIGPPATPQPPVLCAKMLTFEPSIRSDF